MTVPKYREVNLKRRYGLTLADYDAHVESQDGKCILCSSETNPLHVDHCHETNEIRGLLCLNCNTGLGKFKESAELLGKAKDYIMTADVKKDRAETIVGGVYDRGVHYRYQYKGVKLDPFRIAKIYNCNGVQLTILKKVLVVGERGHKSAVEDYRDIINAASRAIEMLEEDLLDTEGDS